MGQYYGGGEHEKYLKAAGKCAAKYAATWPKLQKRAAGTGATCDAVRFAGNSTAVTDRLTGLEWEKKTDDGGIRDKDNFYHWTTGADSNYTDADGTAFTTFLRTLNADPCFAGQCDWRLPTVAELQTILLAPHPCTEGMGLCIHAVFGLTNASYYWSSTTYADAPDLAWYVDFNVGGVGYSRKDFPGYVRAVRGGL